MRRSLSQDMARFGNLATRAQLRDLGYSRGDVQRAIESNQVWPIRRFWLAHSGADSGAIRAVALGGRLASSSALASYGVWVTRSTGLWVGTVQGASRLPTPGRGEHRLWVRERFPQATDKAWRMSLPDALAQYARYATTPDLIAAFDSALNSGLLTRQGLDAVLDALPRRYRRLAARVDKRAQSGLETLLRLAAEAEGWRVDIQVKIVGVGRVDVLIEGWLVIELDGARWHDDELSRDEDSRRDAELTLLGYRAQRFRSTQIIDQMPLCLEVIRTILASGRPLGRAIAA